jgi:DNA polymerase I-like protein with 3'-5' exonuclease and polymerase domains
MEFSLMLLIWTTDHTPKVLRAIGTSLRGAPHVKYEICNNFAYLPDRPDLRAVLALGAGPFKHLQDLGVVPKNRTVTSMRNAAIEVEGLSASVILSYSTGIGDMDYGKYVDLLCDTKLAIRLHDTGSITPPVGAYKYVEHFTELLARVRATFTKTGKPVDVALDLETVGFDPYRLPDGKGHPGGYVVTIQATDMAGYSDAIHFPNREALRHRLNTDLEFVVQLRELLTSPMISMRGANLKFDLNWLFVHTAIECTNFKFDTTLVGSLLDENRSNSLNMHAKVYTTMGGYDDEFNAGIDKGRMDLIEPKILLPYACGDSDATYQVAAKQKAELIQDPALARFYVNILHPAARAMEQVEQGGICIDLGAYLALEAELNAEIDGLLEKAKKIMGGRIVAKHQDLSKRGGLNITKASLLNDFMFSPMGLNLKPKMYTEKSGQPSAALEHLMMFANVDGASEFVGLLGDFASATKTMSTYVLGFQKHIRSDGRYHPTYFLFAAGNGDGGTNTGRLSCRDPAFQTLPKHTKWAKKLRKCFPAPPGMLVMENDYSQGELRVIACIANEPTMIEAYRNNQDLHVITPSQFVGFTVEEILAMEETDPAKFDAIRKMGKAGNFGLIYGMSAGGFQEYAAASYGVHMTSAESNGFRDGFFDTYPALPEYHKEYKAFAKLHGFVRSPLGRVRHLPLINSPMGEVRSGAERQAINAPVQGTLSDMMIWAIAEGKAKGYHKDAPCFGLVHDAGYRYIPEDNYEFYAKREKEQMENLPFERVGWNPQLTFVTDCKVGKTMAELKKLAL